MLVPSANECRQLGLDWANTKTVELRLHLPCSAGPRALGRVLLSLEAGRCIRRQSCQASNHRSQGMLCVAGSSLTPCATSPAPFPLTNLTVHVTHVSLRLQCCTNMFVRGCCFFPIFLKSQRFCRVDVPGMDFVVGRGLTAL